MPEFNYDKYLEWCEDRAMQDSDEADEIERRKWRDAEDRWEKDRDYALEDK